MKIYTRTGDSGMTSLASGERVPKNSPRVEAYGTLDELNSWLGVLRFATAAGCGASVGTGGAADCGASVGADGGVDCGTSVGAGGGVDCGTSVGAGGGADCGTSVGAGGGVDCGTSVGAGGGVDCGTSVGAGGGIPEDLKAIQVFLMEASSHLASATVNARLKPLDAGRITWLEDRIDALSATLPPQTSFLIPGGSLDASFAHVARTVARRAERLIAAIADRTPQDETALAFVNRLADYLFVLARHLCITGGVPEERWI